MARLTSILAVLCFAVLSCGGDDGGGLKGVLSGKKITGGAKGLKPGADGKVGGKEATVSTTPVDAPETGGGIAAPNNIQSGDTGDESYQDVAYDMDGDGTSESVDVTVDDESGDTYYSWQEEDGSNVLVIDNGDGTYDIYVETAEGTVYCDGATETSTGNCMACPSGGGECQPLDDDNLYGGFEEPDTGTPPDGNACVNCIEECGEDEECAMQCPCEGSGAGCDTCMSACEQNCSGEACAYCEQGCAFYCG